MFAESSLSTVVTIRLQMLPTDTFYRLIESAPLCTHRVTTWRCWKIKPGTGWGAGF
jgi:hypothetical protein